MLNGRGYPRVFSEKGIWSNMKEKFYLKSVEETFSSLKTSENGLTSSEAKTRLKRDGANELKAKKQKNLVQKFFAQFKDVFVVILLCAAAITAVIAIIEENYGDFVDVGIILAIVIINAVIGVAQEAKADSALKALQDMSKPFAKVRRDGEVIKIPSAEIVVGDIVILEAGDVVPADLRLFSAKSLKIEESALTGESLAVEKSVDAIENEQAPLGDRTNTAYSASVVTYGRGEGVVVATGMETEVGKIADMLSADEDEVTPIQKKLSKTGKIISIGVIIIAAVIFAVSILSIIRINFTVDKIINAFMTSVAIAVAAIPEGLTAVITIIMALGVRKMSNRNAIVKKLPAVETLGSTQIICSDKTGTLTMNKMTVTKIDASAPAKEHLKNCMILCNDTMVHRDENAAMLLGDPTETALIAFYDPTGIECENLRKACPRVDEVPFDSERKLMTTVNEINGKRLVYVKGATDMLVKRCTRFLSDDGVHTITDADKDFIAAKNHEFASQALRVLAYAYKEDDGSDYESDLIFLGLSGMIDPPRKEVKAAVATCKRAGITPVMITGDHKDTAFAIACELDIANDLSQVVTGAELSEMSDEELAEKVTFLRVYARVSPEHKVRIVKAWKSLGKTVAMTGDGVNDAPGIKAADIGVGMGITGTDVTKGAADVVLTDDNFATIVDAVEEGRKIFDNIQKAIQFLLSANISEVLCLFITTMVFSFMGVDLTFLLPVQILWINLVTDSLPALALGMENSDEDIMNRPPRISSDNLFAGSLGINIIYQGALQTLITLGIFFGAKAAGVTHETAVTMAFVALCLTQLFHCFNAKSLNGTIFKKTLFNNRFMLLSFAVGAALTVGVVLIPGLNAVFGLTDITIIEWLITVGAALSIIPLVELVKLFIRSIKKNNQ